MDTVFIVTGSAQPELQSAASTIWQTTHCVVSDLGHVRDAPSRAAIQSAATALREQLTAAVASPNQVDLLCHGNGCLAVHQLLSGRAAVDGLIHDLYLTHSAFPAHRSWSGCLEKMSGQIFNFATPTDMALLNKSGFFRAVRQEPRDIGLVGIRSRNRRVVREVL